MIETLMADYCIVKSFVHVIYLRTVLTKFGLKLQL